MYQFLSAWTVFTGGSVGMCKLRRRILCFQHWNCGLHILCRGYLFIQHRSAELDSLRQLRSRPIRKHCRNIKLCLHWHLPGRIILAGRSILMHGLCRRIVRKHHRPFNFRMHWYLRNGLIFAGRSFRMYELWRRILCDEYWNRELYSLCCWNLPAIDGSVELVSLHQLCIRSIRRRPRAFHTCLGYVPLASLLRRPPSSAFAALEECFNRSPSHRNVPVVLWALPRRAQARLTLQVAQ